MAARNIRRDGPHRESPSRIAVGVSVASSCQTLQAALVEVAGHGLAIRPTIAAAIAIPLEDPLAGRLRKIAACHGADVSAQVVGEVRAELATAQCEAIQRLAAAGSVPTTRILVAGIDDPGLWCVTGAGHHYLSLCDAARLAETSGTSVVDGFPARDLAQGGQGGPIGALAQWILLKHSRDHRLLVDLGRTARMSLLPADSCPLAASRILAFDVGPGTWLLDELTAKLTGGRHRFDPGGRLAVQGRRIEALLEHWLADHVFRHTLPRWHPRGVRPDRLLGDAMRMAVESHWSIQDVLCTATHLVAEAVARAVRQQLPPDLHMDRVVITGGGQHNGMLFEGVVGELPELRVSRLAELGTADEALQPACAAILALFHLDQVPGNLSSVTGAEIPRVLGRLTPGSPQNWQRLVDQMSGVEASLRPLRSAF